MHMLIGLRDPIQYTELYALIEDARRSLQLRCISLTTQRHAVLSLFAIVNRVVNEFNNQVFS